MKYTKEISDKLIADYLSGTSTLDLSEQLSTDHAEVVPERSIIAKLASLGVYKKKEYLTKRGETPVKKEEYIERIAKLLDVNAEILESLEKVNKSVLSLIEKKLTLDPQLERLHQITTAEQYINYFTDPRLTY
jgi:type IV secretory pathway VirB4 component